MPGMLRANKNGGVSIRRPLTPKGGQLLTSVAFGLLFLFVFAIPLENALVLPGIGTFGRAVGLAAFALGILAVAENGKVRSPSAIPNPSVRTSLSSAWEIPPWIAAAPHGAWAARTSK